MSSMLNIVRKSLVITLSLLVVGIMMLYIEVNPTLNVPRYFWATYLLLLAVSTAITGLEILEFFLDMLNR